LQLAAAFAAAASAALPAAAAIAKSTARCWHRWTDTLSPGVTTQRQTVAFTSGGETGTIDCRGSVEGRRITGPGTFGEQGTYDGSCTSGSGSATFSMTLPTASGPLKLRMPVVFTFAGFGVTTTKTFPGVFFFAPLAGNCLTPVTKIAIFRAGTLKT
jgi:hypothetical protein